MRGVGAASRAYFGKEVHQLTLPEAALLAGMIRGPNNYSPVANPERARERRDVVLTRMRDLGKISEADYRRARKEPVRARTTPANGLMAPYFVDYVRAELERNADIDLADLHGVRVYTTLDPVLQRLAEAAVVKGMDRLETLRPRLRRKNPEERLQVAMIVLDPATGQVRALVGGRDYRASQFNRAVLARRQPGSAFKPFVFLAALTPRKDASLFTPASLIEDAPITVMVDGKPWTPKNYDDRYEGPVTVRRALEGSLNTATVRVAQAVGLPVVIETARAMGMEVDLKPVPALTLGVFEITPLALARAYLPLANGGLAPTGGGVVETVADEGGRALWSASREARPVIGAPEAYLVTSLLEGVINVGTGGLRARGGRARRGGRQDGHDQRGPGRLVRRLLAEPARAGLGGLRRRHAGRAIRVGGRAADLVRVHAAGARHLPGRRVPGAGRHHPREGGRDHRPAGHRVLPARRDRGVPGRQRAAARARSTAVASRSRSSAGGIRSGAGSGSSEPRRTDRELDREHATEAAQAVLDVPHEEEGQAVGVLPPHQRRHVERRPVGRPEPELSRRPDVDPLLGPHLGAAGRDVHRLEEEAALAGLHDDEPGDVGARVATAVGGVFCGDHAGGTSNLRASAGCAPISSTWVHVTACGGPSGPRRDADSVRRLPKRVESGAMSAATAEVVICGAGMAGVAAAYHLAVRRGIGGSCWWTSARALSLTSDKSAESYRNWWPGPGDVMVALMNRSIDLMEELARESGNVFLMNRRGYLFATAQPEQVDRYVRAAEEAAGLRGRARPHASLGRGRPISPRPPPATRSSPSAPTSSPTRA